MSDKREVGLKLETLNELKVFCDGVKELRVEITANKSIKTITLKLTQHLFRLFFFLDSYRVNHQLNKSMLLLICLYISLRKCFGQLRKVYLILRCVGKIELNRI